MPKRTPLSRDLVQRLKTGIRDTSQLHVTHHLPVDLRDGSIPHSYTVDVFQEPHGMFVATCYELSQVLVAGETEDEALAKAEGDIRFLIAARRGTSPP